jgi:hypothetical protein
VHGAGAIRAGWSASGQHAADSGRAVQMCAAGLLAMAVIGSGGKLAVTANRLLFEQDFSKM